MNRSILISGLALALVVALALWRAWPGAVATAPDIAVKTLDGRTLALADLRGRPLLVTFWATSCPSCLKEIPHLAALHTELNPAGLEILAIAMAYDPPNRVVELTRNRALPYTVALDLDGTAARAFGNVRLTPSTFLIDPQGHVIRQQIGLLDLTQWRKSLERML